MFRRILSAIASLFSRRKKAKKKNSSSIYPMY